MMPLDILGALFVLIMLCSLSVCYVSDLMTFYNLKDWDKRQIFKILIVGVGLVCAWKWLFTFSLFTY